MVSLVGRAESVTGEGVDQEPEPSKRRGFRRRRRILALVAVAFLALAGYSFATSVYGQPGSLGARAAEWARDHGGARLVAAVEDLWYSHHPPPTGGRPKAGLIPAPTSSAKRTPASAVAHLAAPTAMVPIASPAVPGEGQWHAAGRTVAGIPTLYEAFLRPDPVHTSLVAGVAWMDTRLLRAALYSGSYIPGDGPWALTAPVAPDAAASLSAAFNSGFRLKDSRGGYYAAGRLVAPLVDGAASVVIYRDGSITVGRWGRDVSKTRNVVAVRQNLSLVVDGGAPVSGLDSNSLWGGTLGNKVYVWRSGLGVTASGALVYVGGPGLDASSLAQLLVRAGVVRGMELDINTDWVNFTAYTLPVDAGRSTPANGTTLLPNMYGGPGRYFLPSWNRDFFTLSVAPTAASVPSR